MYIGDDGPAFVAGAVEYTRGLMKKISDMPYDKIIDTGVIRKLSCGGHENGSLVCNPILLANERIALELPRLIGQDILFPEPTIEEYSDRLNHDKNFVKGLAKYNSRVEIAYKSRAVDIHLNGGFSLKSPQMIARISVLLNQRVNFRKKVMKPNSLESRLPTGSKDWLFEFERAIIGVAEKYSSSKDYSSRYG